MTTTTKHLTCCHCLHRGNAADPVRENWDQRSRNGAAMCVDAVKCWKRFDALNKLSEKK
jgi:hypothetical protein